MKSIDKIIKANIFSEKPNLSNNKLFFKELEEEKYNENPINKLKSSIKRNHILYKFAISIFSPVFTFYSNIYLNRFIKNHLSNTDQIFLNLGSGNSNIHPSVYNVDFFPYKNVDIVCDISNIPFKDNSIDIISNIAVLEHVPNPEKVVEEIYRVLKPGGKVYSVVPFIQGFHASPFDFTRRTYEGMNTLYKKFENKKIKCIGGPTSGVLWISQEWLAIVFSFGISALHKILYILLLVISWPIKLLDIILIHHPKAKNISSAFLIECEKPK